MVKISRNISSLTNLRESRHPQEERSHYAPENLRFAPGPALQSTCLWIPQRGRDTCPWCSSPDTCDMRNLLCDHQWRPHRSTWYLGNCHVYSPIGSNPDHNKCYQTEPGKSILTESWLGCSLSQPAWQWKQINCTIMWSIPEPIFKALSGWWFRTWSTM